MPQTPDQYATALARGPQPQGGGLMRLFAVAVRADTAENFQRAVTPDDRPWPPLQHARPRGGTSPLLDTGLLRAAATSPAARGHVERVGPNWLVYGVSLVYAALHQFGGVVVPKLAKWLAIPITREAQRAGSPRRFPRPLDPVFGPVGGVLKEAGTDLVQYVLTKSVTIPPRPFIGVGPRLVRKLTDIARQWAKRNVFGEGSSGGGAGATGG